MVIIKLQTTLRITLIHFLTENLLRMNLRPIWKNKRNKESNTNPLIAKIQANSINELNPNRMNIAATNRKYDIEVMIAIY